MYQMKYITSTIRGKVGQVLFLERYHMEDIPVLLRNPFFQG
jgi:hypothetical protein